MANGMIRTETETKGTVLVSQEFAAVIRKVKGKPSLVVKSVKFYEYQLGKYQADEEVTLIITNRAQKRTDKQNRYYRGAVLPMIAAETGEEDMDRLHELFKRMFLSLGYKMILGNKVHLTKSTTELTTLEFSNYIRKICAEVGCIPPPAESFGLPKI